MPRFTLTVRTRDYRAWRPEPRATGPAPVLDVGWHKAFSLLAGETVLLSCGATPSFYGDGKLFLTNQRLIHTPRRALLGNGVPLTRVHIWEKSDITDLDVRRGQPLFCSPSGLIFSLLIFPVLLVGFAILTVLTVGIFPLVWLFIWLKDRLTGTYLVLTSDHERVWFYLKSTSCEDAQGALRAFRLDRGRRRARDWHESLLDFAGAWITAAGFVVVVVAFFRAPLISEVSTTDVLRFVREYAQGWDKIHLALWAIPPLAIVGATSQIGSLTRRMGSLASASAFLGAAGVLVILTTSCARNAISSESLAPLFWPVSGYFDGARGYAIMGWASLVALIGYIIRKRAIAADRR